MGYALYAQHVLYLEPCPLCIFQRVGVIATGVLFLLAALLNPQGRGRVVSAIGIAVAAGSAVAVAARHVWLQNLPPDKVPSCGAGLDFMLETLPFMQVLNQVFTGSGECADIKWSLLGLTMPTWVLISMLIVGLFGVIANLRFRF